MSINFIFFVPDNHRTKYLYETNQEQNLADQFNVKTVGFEATEESIRQVNSLRQNQGDLSDNLCPVDFTGEGTELDPNRVLEQIMDPTKSHPEIPLPRDDIATVAKNCGSNLKAIVLNSSVGEGTNSGPNQLPQAEAGSSHSISLLRDDITNKAKDHGTKVTASDHDPAGIHQQIRYLGKYQQI